MKELSDRQKIVNLLPYHLLIWLCASNLLSKFVSNAVYDGFLIENYHELRKYRNTDRYIFTTAFPYAATPEGVSFWFRRKWELEEYLKQIQNKLSKL